MCHCANADGVVLLKRKETLLNLSASKFDKTTNLCYSHQGPVAQGDGETSSECTVYSTLTEEQGECISWVCNTVAKQYRQSFELSHTPPLQNRVREEECLNKCKHAFLHSWNHGLHLTKRREYITNMDRLAQQAKAAPSYFVTLLEAWELWEWEGSASTVAVRSN